MQGFGGKPEGNRLLGRLRCRWEDDIKLYLPEVLWEQGLDRPEAKQ